MPSYKLTRFDTVQRLSDGAFISPDGRGWDEYVAFLAAGGVPDPADPLPPEDPRILAIKTDADRVALRTILNTKTNAEIKNFVTTNIVADNTVKKLLYQILLDIAARN